MKRCFVVWIYDIVWTDSFLLRSWLNRAHPALYQPQYSPCVQGTSYRLSVYRLFAVRLYGFISQHDYCRCLCHEPARGTRPALSLHAARPYQPGSPLPIRTAKLSRFEPG
eukprot:scaffold41331_cov65-Phaeocystis_antarctica.AAC.7